MTLIAIVNPRGPEDANASAVALFGGRILPPNMRLMGEKEKKKKNVGNREENQRRFWLSLNKILEQLEAAS